MTNPKWLVEDMEWSYAIIVRMVFELLKCCAGGVGKQYLTNTITSRHIGLVGRKQIEKLM